MTTRLKDSGRQEEDWRPGGEMTVGCPGAAAVRMSDRQSVRMPAIGRNRLIGSGRFRPAKGGDNEETLISEAPNWQLQREHRRDPACSPGECSRRRSHTGLQARALDSPQRGTMDGLCQRTRRFPMASLRNKPPGRVDDVRVVLGNRQ